MNKATQDDSGKTRAPIATKIGTALAVIIGLALLLSVALYFLGYRGRNVPTSVLFLNTARSSEIASRMKVDLLRSIQLEQSAVMAVTDEDSKTLADRSRKASDAVESGYLELKGLVEAEGTREELRLMNEFGDCWKNLRAIDNELLTLSVENTNIKAAKLSFTKGSESIHLLQRALGALTDLPLNGRIAPKVMKAAFRAMTAAYGIYSLQAPHIDEAQDQEMDRIESTMKTHEEQAGGALREIERLVAGHEKGEILSRAASGAFADFMKVNREVLRLSRMNSNVKSLQLSMGKKRKVASQCEELLDSIQDALQERTFKATR